MRRTRSPVVEQDEQRRWPHRHLESFSASANSPRRLAVEPMATSMRGAMISLCAQVKLHRSNPSKGAPGEGRRRAKPFGLMCTGDRTQQFRQVVEWIRKEHGRSRPTCREMLSPGIC
jgi:hypothetical protein